MPPDHLPDDEEMDEDFSEDVGMEILENTVDHI